ncbi:MAG: hypothetical protein ACLGIZ_07840 [Acidimicrobiia bacterium]
MAAVRTTSPAGIGDQIARLAAGDPGPGPWVASPLDHRVENMTTARLERRSGPLADGTPWSVVVKTLQPASAHWSFAEIPSEFHAEVLEDLDWRAEPHVYRSGLGAALPPPMRMPEVHAIVEDGPGLVSIWMEDVDDVGPWDLARHGRTAAALGALGGRWTGEQAADAFGLGGRDIGNLFCGKVLNHDLPMQADDAFWDDPVVAETVDEHHRRDLGRLADAIPGLLAAARAAATGVCHGDASPDNFREPGDGTIVALDWSYGHVGVLGSDLAQLLAGRFASGAAGDADPEPVADTVFEGYLDGLDRAGRSVDAAQVRLGFALHLAVRFAFCALPLEHHDGLDDEDRRRVLTPRARLARFAIDQALALAG